MEQLLSGILSGNINAASLLMLFIVGILTKRFVPWWIHEEVLEKLREYEDAAPALIEQVQELIQAMNQEKGLPKNGVKSDNIIKTTEALTHVVNKKVVPTRRRARTRR